MSVSLSNSNDDSIDADAPSSTPTVSGAATGGSLTGVTATRTMAESLASPSLTVYEKRPAMVSEPSCT